MFKVQTKHHAICLVWTTALLMACATLDLCFVRSGVGDQSSHLLCLCSCSVTSFMWAADFLPAIEQVRAHDYRSTRRPGHLVA